MAGRIISCTRPTRKISTWSAQNPLGHGSGAPPGKSLQAGPAPSPADLAVTIQKVRQYGNSVIVMTLYSAYDTIDSYDIKGKKSSRTLSLLWAISEKDIV